MLQLSFDEAMKIRHDYQYLKGKQACDGRHILDVVVGPASAAGFKAFFDCYCTSKDDIQCMKDYTSHPCRVYVLLVSFFFMIEPVGLEAFAGTENISFDPGKYSGGAA